MTISVDSCIIVRNRQIAQYRSTPETGNTYWPAQSFPAKLLLSGRRKEMTTRDDLRNLVKRRLETRELIVVSNREPYIHNYSGDDIICEQPVGGLTTAIDPVVRASGGKWVAYGSGKADREVVDNKDRVRVPPDNPSYTLRRVWLSREELDGYYSGFANSALWPLCHTAYTRPVFDMDHWQVYREVNEKFAEAIVSETEGTDEDAFRALRGKAWPVFVGDASADTLAQYYLESPAEVVSFLEFVLKTLQDRGK